MAKIFNFRQSINIVIILLVSFILLPTVAFAARIYLSPSSGEYYQGDTFLVEIRVDTEGEDVNAIETNLIFSQDVLEMKDFSKGNSILTLWIEEPAFSNQSGLISFSGGAPFGYQGTNGILGKMVFKVKKQGLKNQAKILFVSGSQVLLNDGLGTKTNVITQGAVFKILPEISEISADEWQTELKRDKIPPEPFKVEIGYDSSAFDGKCFLVFSTADKQTGIDYYEVKEGERDWKIAQSPYLLENQSLGERIKVKAVDKAGNARIQMIKPSSIEVEEEIKWKDISFLIILMIIGIGVILCIIKKIRYVKKQ